MEVIKEYKETTSTSEYPIWIHDSEIYCDSPQLKQHLTQKLNYDDKKATKLTHKVTKLLDVSSNIHYFWWKVVVQKNGQADAIKALLESMSSVHRIHLLSVHSAGQYTALLW